jgi:hypothetical protein
VEDAVFWDVMPCGLVWRKWLYRFFVLNTNIFT